MADRDGDSGSDIVMMAVTAVWPPGQPSRSEAEFCTKIKTEEKQTEACRSRALHSNLQSSITFNFPRGSEQTSGNLISKSRSLPTPSISHQSNDRPSLTRGTLGIVLRFAPTTHYLLISLPGLKNTTAR